MTQVPHGSIVLTSSVAGLCGFGMLAHYTAAKHGVVGLMRALVNEVSAHHIRVNSIHPTSVNTDMVDIANAALFLASEEARYITGLTMYVDAGFLTKVP